MPINYSLQTLLFHPAHLTRMALKPSPWKDSIFTQFQIKQNLLKIDRTRATKTHLQKTNKKTPHKKKYKLQSSHVYLRLHVENIFKT